MAKKATRRSIKSKKVILPKKMSKLIKVALRDMRKAEAKPDKYVINMSEWYNPDQTVDCVLSGDNNIVIESKPVCVMCAAGSVMAFTLKATKAADGPEHFPDNEHQLSAIDDLRCGQVGAAAAELGLHETEWDESTCSYKPNQFERYNTHIPEYDRDKPEPFHKAMEKLQAKLEKAGL